MLASWRHVQTLSRSHWQTPSRLQGHSPMCFFAYGGVAQKLLLEFGKSVSSPSINEGTSEDLTERAAFWQMLIQVLIRGSCELRFSMYASISSHSFGVRILEWIQPLLECLQCLRNVIRGPGTLWRIDWVKVLKQRASVDGRGPLAETDAVECR